MIEGPEPRSDSDHLSQQHAGIGNRLTPIEGPLWTQMSGQPRRLGASISKADVPTAKGVYAWYYGDTPMYVGRAKGRDGLRGRVWKDHLNADTDMSRSSFRRNVGAYLGVLTVADAKVRPSILTEDQASAVNAWIRSCTVAWIVCGGAKEATKLEERLKREWKPPLTMR